jgi:Outer membrane protein beta-barrel domain
MNEKGANIDLLFRNGLKDFEVLPPPGVCDGILSSVKIKSGPVVYLRVAAAVAVLITLSFFTYQWTREVVPAQSDSQIALNLTVSSPIVFTPAQDMLYLGDKKQNMAVTSYISDETENSVPAQPEIETAISPFKLLNIPETKSLSIIKSESKNDLFLTPIFESRGKSVKITYSDLQYFTNNVLTKPVKRWSIAAMASPTYYSTINTGSDPLTSQLMSSEDPLFSYSGGVGFSYKISKRISVESGIYYSSLGQKVDGIYSFSGFQKYNNSKGGPTFEVPTTSGTVYTSNPDVFLASYGNGKVLTAYTNDVFDPQKASLQYISNSLTQNFSYLELPVIVRYKIIDKTIGINLIGGLSYNLLVNNSAYAIKDGNKFQVGDTKGLNPLTLSSSLGMGMEYNLSEKLSLNLEPTFRYYLNPFSVTSGSYIHPYSFGIFSGVSYKF